MQARPSAVNKQDSKLLTQYPMQHSITQVRLDVANEPIGYDQDHPSSTPTIQNLIHHETEVVREL